jgi:hypothetical protein
MSGLWKKHCKKRAPDTVKNWATLQPEAQCWTRRYEQLREQVLAKDTLIGTDFRGLSLLIRQGVVAWMRGWCEPLPFPAVAALEAQNRPIIARESWQKEATRLLANMALSHFKPRPSSS